MRKKQRIVRIVLLILLALVMGTVVKNIFQSCCGAAAEDATEYAMVSAGDVGEIREGTLISQTFAVDRDFAGISLYMNVYGKLTDSTVTLRILDETSGEVLAEETYSTKPMDYNGYFHYLFENRIEVSGTRICRLEFRSNAGKLSDMATICTTEGDAYPQGALYVNDMQQENDLVFNLIYDGEKYVKWGLFWHRTSLVVLLFVFLALHVVLDIKKMYQWIFEKRVYAAIGLFVFMVANNYNFSSIGQYNSYIQPGEGSEYIVPVYGKPRAIRSDEWLVTVPRMMAAEYSDYGKYNEVVRGTKSTTLSATGLYFHYSALAKPMEWGFYLFGSEYGLSFWWNFKMIFGFLFSYELCLIIAKRRKLIALLGASLIWFSSFNMWWSGVNWLLAGQAALVFVYYYLQEDVRWKRLLYGVGIALSGACFVVEIYPAWQVPAGYLYLAMLIWMFAENIKKIKAYKVSDWAMAAGCIGFMASIIIVYLLNNSEYLTAVTQTVYPGKRVSYGGYGLGKLFGYIPALLMPWAEYGNASEAGMFVNFFPIPYIVTFMMMIKSRKKDLLSGILLVVTTFLTAYCITELPAILAQATFLTYSTPERTVDIVGYSQIFMLLAVLSRFEEEDRIKTVTAAAISALTGMYTLWYVKENFAGYTEYLYFAVLGIGAFIGIVLLIGRTSQIVQNTVMIAASLVMIFTGSAVHPLMCGIDAITSKPVAKKVQQLTEADSEGIWIATDTGVNGNFLIALGAPTLNSVNYVPNMELWKVLDPEKEFEEYYNRYAHIEIHLTDEELSMELTQADFLRVNLPYDRLDDIGADYIYAVRAYSEEEMQKYGLEELYAEAGSYIYCIGKNLSN